MRGAKTLVEFGYLLKQIRPESQSNIFTIRDKDDWPPASRQKKIRPSPQTSPAQQSKLVPNSDHSGCCQKPTESPLATGVVSGSNPTNTQLEENLFINTQQQAAPPAVVDVEKSIVDEMLEFGIEPVKTCERLAAIPTTTRDFWDQVKVVAKEKSDDPPRLARWYLENPTKFRSSRDRRRREFIRKLTAVEKGQLPSDLSGSRVESSSDPELPPAIEHEVPESRWQRFEEAVRAAWDESDPKSAIYSHRHQTQMRLIEQIFALGLTRDEAQRFSGIIQDRSDSGSQRRELVKEAKRILGVNHDT
jgi:hypothetical protein